MTSLLSQSLFIIVFYIAFCYRDKKICVNIIYCKTILKYKYESKQNLNIISIFDSKLSTVRLKSQINDNNIS